MIKIFQNTFKYLKNNIDMKSKFHIRIHIISILKQISTINVGKCWKVHAKYSCNLLIRISNVRSEKGEFNVGFMEHDFRRFLKFYWYYVIFTIPKIWSASHASLMKIDDDASMTSKRTAMIECKTIVRQTNYIY